MATDPPADLELDPIGSRPRTVREWLTTFHLVFVALDPYHRESAAIVDTAARILLTFQEADCRISFLVTGDERQARRLLGPLADEVLTFTDPSADAVRGFGLEHLPAFVHLGADGSIAGADEGWHPQAWRAIAVNLAQVMHWRPAPTIPGPGDPAPYEGAPVRG